MGQPILMRRCLEGGIESFHAILSINLPPNKSNGASMPRMTEVIGQTRQHQEKFVWDLITSPDELGRFRLEAMGDFLNDYEQGQCDGRYILAQLPDLPFAPSIF